MSEAGEEEREKWAGVRGVAVEGQKRQKTIVFRQHLLRSEQIHDRFLVKRLQKLEGFFAYVGEYYALYINLKPPFYWRTKMFASLEYQHSVC